MNRTYPGRFFLPNAPDTGVSKVPGEGASFAYSYYFALGTSASSRQKSTAIRKDKIVELFFKNYCNYMKM